MTDYINLVQKRSPHLHKAAIEVLEFSLKIQNKRLPVIFLSELSSVLPAIGARALILGLDGISVSIVINPPRECPKTPTELISTF